MNRTSTNFLLYLHWKSKGFTEEKKNVSECLVSGFMAYKNAFHREEIKIKKKKTFVDKKRQVNKRHDGVNPEDKHET